jgi:hypothetical protein
MKNKLSNIWMPIDFINKYIGEYISYVSKMYRLRFANLRLKSKIREARELTQTDRKKRWIIEWHDKKFYIVQKKQIAQLKKQGVLKQGATSADLDNYALRVITFVPSEKKAVVTFNNLKNEK